MSVTRDDIINEIKKVYDPEIPVNIWDLGLIYDISINKDNILIEMTFTSPTCPMMEDILNQVKTNVESISDGIPVEIKLYDKCFPLTSSRHNGMKPVSSYGKFDGLIGLTLSP